MDQQGRRRALPLDGRQQQIHHIGLPLDHLLRVIHALASKDNLDVAPKIQPLVRLLPQYRDLMINLAREHPTARDRDVEINHQLMMWIDNLQVGNVLVPPNVSSSH